MSWFGAQVAMLGFVCGACQLFVAVAPITLFWNEACLPSTIK